MLRKYLVLGIMMGALALTGCGAEEKGNSDTKDKNVANESSSENSSGNKNTITPTDTISGLELAYTYEFDSSKDGDVGLYYNNLIVCDDNGANVIDIYGSYDNQILESKGVSIRKINSTDNFLDLVLEVNTTGDKEDGYEYYLFIISKDGKVIYTDGLGYGSIHSCNRHIINSDGNVVYLDNNDTIKCINTLTGEEVYKIESVDYFYPDDVNDCFIRVDAPNDVKKVYNILTGELLLETTIKEIEESKVTTNYTGYLFFVDNYLVLQELDETGTTYLKHSVYDENGALVFSTDKAEEIPVIKEVGWNNSMLCAFYNATDSYHAICKADLTPITTISKDPYSLELLTDRSTVLENVCLSKISIYSNRDNSFGYIITDTEAIEFTEIESIPYDDWFITYSDTNNKRYMLNLANGTRIEVEPTEGFTIGSDTTMISNYFSSQAKPVFFAETTDTETKVYDENGNLLVTTEKGKYGPSFCTSVDMKKIVISTDTYAIIYDTESKTETKITSEEPLSSVKHTIIKDKYLMFYQINDRMSGACTLKQYNIETGEITHLLDAKDDDFNITDDMIITRDYNGDTSTSTYNIYTYK